MQTGMAKSMSNCNHRSRKGYVSNIQETKLRFQKGVVPTQMRGYAPSQATPHSNQCPTNENISMTVNNICLQCIAV